MTKQSPSINSSLNVVVRFPTTPGRDKIAVDLPEGLRYPELFQNYKIFCIANSSTTAKKQHALLYNRLSAFSYFVPQPLSPSPSYFYSTSNEWQRLFEFWPSLFCVVWQCDLDVQFRAMYSLL